MVRKKTDPFWQYVDELPKNRWKCKFCGNKYPGHASRIKAHLGQVKNRGIEVCDKVSEAVKDKALRAINKVAPDAQQSILEAEETTQWNDQGIGFENNPCVHPSSDYDLSEGYQFANHQYSYGKPSHLVVPEVNGLDLPISDTQIQQPDQLPNSYFQQQSEVNTTSGTAQELLRQQNIDQQGASEHPVSLCTNFDQRLLNLKRKLKRLCNQKEEKKEQLYQWSKKLKNQMQEKEEDLHQWSKQVKEIKSAYQSMVEEQREGKYPSLEQLNQVEKVVNQVEENGNSDMSERETSRIAACSKTPLLTSKLIGRDGEKSRIWNYLMTDGILRLGIYGMGGVGKTEIMMNIYNELLNDKAFDNVFWVTMPKDFSVYELQGGVGSAMHLNELSNEHDEKIRAAMLNKFLTSGKKYVIILDGLWRHFDYYDVGIPLTYDGLKLVITCRSLDVSRMMLCQETIKILPFEWFSGTEDDWELFLHELGAEIELPEEVTNIAREIVRICEGLPLYIKAIATRMRGVNNVQGWNYMMEKLNNPKARFHELKGQVLDRLKLSYEFLNDHKLQQCLIYCAFYLKSRTNPGIEEVEEFLVDMGFIDGRNNEEKLLHNAHYILRELERACLLDIEENFDGETYIEMHSSILDMACYVETELNLYKIDLGTALKDITEEEFQIEDLDELYLMRDAANGISRLSSNELGLPILVSKEDSSLRMIPNSLFTTFSELRILNLRGSKIEALPNSFSDLVNLTVLVLRDCGKLRHIPYIGKLKSLRKLNLNGCDSLENLPDGLGYLVNLEYLDYRRSTDVLKLPEGVLRNLRKLQYLDAYYVKAEELEGLTKLKKLFCWFSTLEELTIFAGSFNGKANADIVYDIRVSSKPPNEEYDDYKNRSVVSVFVSMHMERDSYYFLPENVQVLNIFSLGGQRIIWSNFVRLDSLETLKVEDCEELGVIFGEEKDERYAVSNDGISQMSLFPNLQKIIIDGCHELKYLIRPGAETMFSFPSLREIEIRRCRNLQGIVVAPSIYPLQANVAFPCLETIPIEECDEVEEIIAMSSSDSEMPHPIPALAPALSPHFPLLTSLEVWSCDKMKRLLNYDILVHLSNLKSIRVGRCDKMEEVTSTYNQPLTPLPNLKELHLSGLPELINIGVLALACSIESIVVDGCRKIKRIPLPTHQLPNGVHTHPTSLKSIKLNNEKEWKASEWGQPEVRAAVEPSVQFPEWVDFVQPLL